MCERSGAHIASDSSTAGIAGKGLNSAPAILLFRWS